MEELGGSTPSSELKDKGMQTQYEVNNFSRVTLLSKLNSLSFSKPHNWMLYNYKISTKGLS
jgi:hypothetical protein